MMSYLSSVNNIVQHAQDQVILALAPFGQALLDRVCRQPLRTTLPIDLISALNDAPLMDHPPQFSDMIEQVVENSLDGWLEKLQETKRLEITSEYSKLSIFHSMEMEMGPHIIEIPQRIDEPTTIDDLMEELNNLKTLSKAINISDLRVDGSVQSKEPSFVCDLADTSQN